MATGTLPDAGQILNSLINSILLVDDDLAVHFANPAAQQLLAQSSRKLFGTPLPELLSYFSLNIGPFAHPVVDRPAAAGRLYSAGNGADG